MKRRTAVKSIVLFSLGGTMLYACKDKYEAIKSLNLNYLQPENAELDILSDLVERIVPMKGIPALEEHTSLPFILKMVNDCYPVKARDKFVEGYQTFATFVEENTGKAFNRCSEEEKADLLSTLNLDGTQGEDLPSYLALFRTLKSEGLNYLVNTEHVQRQVRYYQMAPGYFKGDVAISDIKNPNEE